MAHENTDLLQPTKASAECGLQMSAQINELAAALAKARAEMKPAAKNKMNPFFKSTYADLEAVEAALSPLPKHGLTTVHVPAFEGGKFGLRVMLVHSSGQWISGFYPVKPTKDDPQSLGSATTYGRRYSLSAITGVVTEDDDGNAAAAPKEAKSKTEESSSAEKLATEKQIKTLWSLWHKAGYSEDDLREHLKRKYNKTSTKELSSWDASIIINGLMNELKQNS